MVDDDGDVRAELRHVLEEERYAVLEASDGKHAMEILRSAVGLPIRLIVLDLVMPRMTGWELVEFLRRAPRFSRIPILVTSGVPVHGDASGIGATLSWLRKPFGREAFVTAVSAAIRAKRPLDARTGDKPSTPRISQSFPHDT